VFIAASAILGITPGPDIVYVITRGAAQGPRAGVAAAAGLSTGIIGHTMLCVAGISAVLAASAPAFTAIKLLGAVYLVYLGVRMWRKRERPDLAGDGERRPLAAIYRQSIVMNLLNPKVALFFLAFLPQFVSADAGPVAVQLGVLGAVFMLVSFAVMSAAGLAGGEIRKRLARSGRAARWVQCTAGGVLVALGIRLAFEPSG
jgi:threonine/homoserine/homoserine lactone efflux protein